MVLIDLDLKMIDHHYLCDELQLTDIIINTVEKIMQRQFPHIIGLQNTQLGQKLCFSSLPSTTHAVLILHTGMLFLIVLYVLTI